MDDKCVVCGRYVPEGRQVCYECEWSAVNRNRKMTREEIKEVLIRHRNAFANDHGWATSVLEALDTAIGVFAEPKEMTAREFAMIQRRLCNKYNIGTTECTGCPLDGKGVCGKFHLDGALIDAVEQWAAAHPEKRRKTYAEDFKEKYPNALYDSDGTPRSCKRYIYGMTNTPCKTNGCVACWNEEMEDEDEHRDTQDM